MDINVGRSTSMNTNIYYCNTNVNLSANIHINSKIKIKLYVVFYCTTSFHDTLHGTISGHFIMSYHNRYIRESHHIRDECSSGRNPKPLSGSASPKTLNPKMPSRLNSDIQVVQL